MNIISLALLLIGVLLLAAHFWEIKKTHGSND